MIPATTVITAVTSQEYGSSQFSSVASRRRTISGTLGRAAGAVTAVVIRAILERWALIVTSRSTSQDPGALGAGSASGHDSRPGSDGRPGFAPGQGQSARANASTFAVSP